MNNPVKPWQFATALLLMSLLVFTLWKLANRPPTIAITDIPRGSNADNALSINMDGH